MTRYRRLTEAEKLDARAALRALEGSEMSLEQAVAIALKQPGGSPRRVAPEMAVEEFLRAAMRRGCRPRTLQFYREQLEVWLNECPAAHLDAISRPQLRAYLEGLDMAPGSVRCRHRAIRALYRWARRQEPPRCGTDPTDGLELELAEVAHTIRFFDPTETALLLKLAGRHAPALALAFFAGIRPEELGGLDGKPRLRWDDVHDEEHAIHVRSEVSKTGKARPIDGLPDTVWHWLGVESESEGEKGLRKEPRTGPVLTIQWDSLVVDLKRKLLALHPQKKSPWIQDGPRHTFATMALALTGDPGQVATWLGHEGSTRLIFTNYRGVKTRDGRLVTKKLAEAFWSLRPA